MDVIVGSNNDPVNDMTTPVSGLINDLDKVIKIKSICICIILEISSLLSNNYPGLQCACVMDNLIS